MPEHGRHVQRSITAVQPGIHVSPRRQQALDAPGVPSTHCRAQRLAAAVGRHFKLDDARIWMRLMFWTAREEGLFAASPRFAEWYVRFIGHFVRIYESTAPAFARESARWSEDQRNIEAYLQGGPSGGPLMSSVIGLSYDAALQQLPADERRDISESRWPYD